MSTDIVPAVQNQVSQVVTPGFQSLQSFELMQRAAKLLSGSTLVPAQYRSVVEKLDKYGKVVSSTDNPSALSNCVIALNMAQRMGADPLMVMQNLYLVEGRPSWSAQWIIAAINGCGRFSPLRFELTTLGRKQVEYVTTYWAENQRQTKTVKVDIVDKQCIAWVMEKGTNARLESPVVSIEMAVKEGWYSKNGSKWQTMDEVMLRYRSAAFFGKIYAPELLMGLQTVEELHDIYEAEPDAAGGYAVQRSEAQREETAPATVTSSGIKIPQRKRKDKPEGEIVIDEADKTKPANEQEKEKGQDQREDTTGIPPDESSPPTQEQFPLASVGHIKAIQIKAQAATITEAEVLKKFGLESFDGISVATANDMLKFIANPS